MGKGLLQILRIIVRHTSLRDALFSRCVVIALCISVVEMGLGYLLYMELSIWYESMKNLRARCLLRCVLAGFFSLVSSYLVQSVLVSPAVAGEAVKASGEAVAVRVHVVDSTRLATGDVTIFLWGIEKVESGTATFHLKARNVLEKKIGDGQVFCTVKQKVSAKSVKAQCINSKEEDLSLFLLRQGYASAARLEIDGSIYEQPYLDAEKQAQGGGKGVWMDDPALRYSGDAQNERFLVSVFIVGAVFILVFAVLCFYIMRGFSRIIDVQNQSMNLAAKDRALQDKEKYIIASMIDAEVKSHKEKIDAYITVYEEALQEVIHDYESSQYHKGGGVLQQNPSLDRCIFDGNAGKLDLLGSIVAGRIIAYYGHVQKSSDYIEINPDMPKEEVRHNIEGAVEHAQMLRALSEQLAALLVQHALIKPLDS